MKQVIARDELAAANGVAGGRQTIYTAGLNWYINRNVRFMFNYLHGDITKQKNATNTTDVGCHVATIVISPTTRPGAKSRTLFNHYSLLRTTEQLFGVPPLGLAQSANGMRSAFGL